MKKVVIVAFVVCSFGLYAQDEKGGIDDALTRELRVDNAIRTEKAAFFDEGNYAMFIHWGIYSSIGNKWKDTTYYGISEWIKSPLRANISDKAYMAEAKNFNPVNFDAKAIAKLAKDAGMKYIIITSKHHDGFAMYGSKSNSFNIVDATPFARDPMKELSIACKEEGLGFGFYYSHNQDWTFPGANGGPKVNSKGKEVGFNYYYREKCLPQVKEITTEYGDIAIVWFDTPGDMEKKYVEELVDVVRKNQPGALISGRAGHGLGDYNSLGDMNIPIENVTGLWETVDVTNDSWGYAWYDKNWKSPKRILSSVISTVARGGTYMLNVGPGPDGTIPLEAQIALRNSGEWIKKYPHVVYNAQPSPWERKLPWGDVTISEGKINLCIYNWPLDGQLFLPGLKNNIISADLWIDGSRQTLATGKSNDWAVIELPAKRPEKLVSIVELAVEGNFDIDKSLSVDPSYTTEIPVSFGKTEEAELKDKSWVEKFGEWKKVTQVENWKTNSKVFWELDFMKAGYYQVDLEYTGEGRLVWNVENEEGHAVQNQQNASTIYNYFQMGLLKFDAPGKHTVSVSLKEGKMDTVSLKGIRFIPLQNLE